MKKDEIKSKWYHYLFIVWLGLFIFLIYVEEFLFFGLTEYKNFFLYFLIGFAVYFVIKPFKVKQLSFIKKIVIFLIVSFLMLAIPALISGVGDFLIGGYSNLGMTFIYNLGWFFLLNTFFLLFAMSGLNELIILIRRLI